LADTDPVRGGDAGRNAPPTEDEKSSVVGVVTVVDADVDDDVVCKTWVSCALYGRILLPSKLLGASLLVNGFDEDDAFTTGSCAYDTYVRDCPNTQTPIASEVNENKLQQE
jgi:hypothetical protein